MRDFVNRFGKVAVSFLLAASLVTAVTLEQSCTPSRLQDGDGDGTGDEPVDPNNPGKTDDPGAMACTSDAQCGTGRRCVDMVCVPDQGTCMTDDECINDSYCACPPEVKASSCVCVSWGRKPRGDHDDMCHGEAFSPGDFKNPILKCQWPPVGTTPVEKDVISTPLVIDLDGDKQSEVVFLVGLGVQTQLIAMSGRDCSVKWQKTTNISGCTHMAAADLDGDGKPEIIALAPGLTIFDGNGNVKASIGTPGTAGCSVDFPPAVANLDGAGPPEIITGGQVARYVATPTPRIEVLWSKTGLTGGTWGIISLAEDLDGDGKMEVIIGNRVYDGITGADKTKPIMSGLGGGYPAVGDFNADGHPDIVLVSSGRSSQRVSVIDYFNNAWIMPPTAAANGWGGAPTVADFDGDGRPEFATASSVQYYVYSPDCLATPKPGKCKGSDPGVLWQSATQDSSSGSTGSSVFDFNGDKIAEVVYRDECWLRVYNGPDGRKLFAAPVTSGTDLEMPVIADTDGDGHADIVVSSDSVQGDSCRSAVSATELGMPHGPPTFGVKIFKDPMDRWMPSRSIWNQHSYHITNVNDDGTIPLSEAPNYKTFNNYRQNVQGIVAGEVPVADPTGRILISPDPGDCVKVWKLAGSVCNRGAAVISPGMPVTFYEKDPRMAGATPLCTARTATAIPVGMCAPASCDWQNPKTGSVDLWMRVNDDGAGGRPFGQCKGGNDVARMPAGQCSNVPG